MSDELVKGDYVFATKYSDGDPWDGWAIGIYDGTLEAFGKPDRHLVIDNNGNQYRRNGFRRCEKITPSEGNYIIAYDKSIVGDDGYYPKDRIINLWEVLKDFRENEPRHTLEEVIDMILACEGWDVVERRKDSFGKEYGHIATREEIKARLEDVK